MQWPTIFERMAIFVREKVHFAFSYDEEILAKKSHSPKPNFCVQNENQSADGSSKATSETLQAEMNVTLTSFNLKMPHQSRQIVKSRLV